MAAYITDLLIVALLVIGITALNGVFTNAIGEKIFGRGKKSQFVDMSDRMSANFKQVGGQGKFRKKTY
ncbi:hypothetical protein CN514_14100 [Bacillus sp. AFS001701]|uniref:hypothetical protein n=1 Tax=Bacillus sp. AFS001701 TaxID=2033480 RepID=UPI000BF5991B|nr:hypothetical protein [Bacillus sp. AFS001701]PET60778.1 hypothetical protein CN514_14100 [Bacillus sp. AFS001701]